MPGVLIDIGRIAELRYIRLDGTTWPSVH